MKAVLKLPYVTAANELYESMYERINANSNEAIYDLFVITKKHYLSYQQFHSGVAISSGEEVS